MPLDDARRRAPRERFEIIRVLGSGGMGVVYEAVDREHRTRVALKTLRSLDAEARMRFKNEFRALQDIHHPNLVGLGELVEEQGRLFFTMELVRGVHFIEYVRPRRGSNPPRVAAMAPTEPPSKTALRGRSAAWLLRDGETFDERRLRASLAQLVRGIEALHAAQKVHRDIKPSNVLVNEEGRVVILDFGLIADLERYPLDFSVVGTAHFMAPEQAAAQPVGPEADWYSVGAMLYVALTGYYPFQLAPEIALDFKQQIEPDPPSTFSPGLPPDLEALCMALLRIDPKERPTGAEVLSRLNLDEPPESAPATSRRSGFVGRRRELSVLRHALAEARSGKAMAVLVEGESGMGKSALMRRFLSQIRGDVVVLAGRCYERESVPYKAVDELIDALCHHLSGFPDEEVRALLPPDAALIGGVFPVLRKVPAIAELALPEAEVIDPRAVRSQVFQALRELFRRLSARAPLVLAIDDLQWADTDGIALLGEVLRSPDAPKLLLVATIRTGSESSARRTSKRRALPESAVRYLRLTRLPDEEADELVSLLLRQAAGRDDWMGAERLDTVALIREADGHPFFIDALVRHRLTKTESAGETRLDDVLWARIQRLDAAPRRLLELIAIAGGPLLLRIAAEVVMADFDELNRQVIALAAANLARTGGSVEGGFIEPYHDRIRETVMSRLDAATRRTWHGRLALALESSGRAELEALAVHWHEAGDPETAAGYAARAGDQAAGALAFEKAAQFYRMALDLFPRGGEIDRSLRARLGDALANAGRGAEAARAYLSACRGTHPAEALELRRRAAENFLRSGYFDEGVACLRDVLAAVDMVIPKTPARALLSLIYRRGELRLRGLSFEEREEARIDKDTLARIDICWSAALGLAMVDNVRGAYFQTRNLLLALEAGEPYRIARALALEVPFVATVGGPGRARVADLLRAAEPIARGTAHPHALGLVRAATGVSEFLMGRWYKSLLCLDEAEAVFRERCTNTAWEQGSVVTFGIWSLWFLGDLIELGRRLPRRLREAEERGDRVVATNLRTCVGNGYWLSQNDPGEARRQAEDAIQSWSKDGFHLQHAYDLIAQTQVDLYEGNDRAAHRRLLESWNGLATSLALRIQVIRVVLTDLRARAAIASARSARDRDSLVRVATEAARSLEAEGMAWVDPIAAVVRAGIAGVERDLDGAKAALDRAICGSSAADMKLLKAAARRRYGEVVGGEEGAGIAAEATRWMREQGVVDPGRMVEALVPGFG
jgi:eukaryotic-like serine/threonine-protein kinase